VRGINYYRYLTTEVDIKKMEIKIRNETKADFREVEELTRDAFWNLYFPGCVEHYLAHTLRDHPDFIPELDFVAECDGKIVGNIMYTRAWLTDEQGQILEIASFGPLSVLPAYQRKGVGSALIRYSLPIALARGIPGIVILGDPHNYCKHGFKNGRDYNIADGNGEYPYALLALELKEKAFSGHTWKYRYSEAFNISEEAAEQFDQGFAPREKGHQYSQDVFAITIRSFVR
jgi:predicted N-acetyltransferase YhbS